MTIKNLIVGVMTLGVVVMMVWVASELMHHHYREMIRFGVGDGILWGFNKANSGSRYV